MSNLTSLPLGMPGPAIHLAETLEIAAAQPQTQVTFHIPLVFYNLTAGPSQLRIELETNISGHPIQTQLVTLSHNGTEEAARTLQVIVNHPGHPGTYAYSIQARVVSYNNIKANPLIGRAVAGISSVTAINGVTGITGPTGPAGPTGLTGYRGFPGEGGLPGPTGTTGYGMTGPTGGPGATGMDATGGTGGAAGPAGPAGLTGPTGAGATGATGLAIRGTTGGGRKGGTGPRGTTGFPGDQGVTGTGEKGPMGPAGFTGPAGITGVELPNAQYLYIADPIGLTYDFQTVLALPQLAIKNVGNVLLKGSFQVSFQPYLIPTRVAVTVSVLFNTTVIQQFSFYSIQQSSDSFPGGERASVDCPFSLTHYNASGTGKYSMQVKIDQPVPDDFDPRAENSYLYAEQEGTSSVVYFIAAGAIQIFDAISGVRKSVPLNGDITGSPSVASAATLDGHYIYYGVQNKLYRFDTFLEQVDQVNLNGINIPSSSKIFNLLLMPDQRHIYIFAGTNYLYDLVDNSAVTLGLMVGGGVTFSTASPDGRLAFFITDENRVYAHDRSLNKYWLNMFGDFVNNDIIFHSNPLTVSLDGKEIKFASGVFGSYYVYCEIDNLLVFPVISKPSQYATSGMAQLDTGDTFIMGAADYNYTGIFLETGDDIGYLPGAIGQFAMILSSDQQWLGIQGTEAVKLIPIPDITNAKVVLMPDNNYGGLSFTRDSRYLITTGQEHMYSISVEDLTVRTFDNLSPYPGSLTDGVYRR